MIPSPLFLGIDTSNYTTSCALCDAEGNILFNGKHPLPVGESERGLRQSDAVFAHIKNLPALMQELRTILVDRRVIAIGVSARPRDAEDSYMPCFLSGVAAAESAAAVLGVPLYRFSHQQGHIRAALETSGAADILGLSDFLSFHVSGGTTELLLVHQTPSGMNVECIGGSKDLHAGQLIDRTGVAMGLRFPCGPAMEREARSFGEFVCKAKLSVSGTECNLSGLENLSLALYRNGASVGEVSAFVFSAISSVLQILTENARAAYGPLPVIYAGGVMSNGIIKSKLSEMDNVYFAEPAYSADNAAGIALLCRNRWSHESHE